MNRWWGPEPPWWSAEGSHQLDPAGPELAGLIASFHQLVVDVAKANVALLAVASFVVSDCVDDHWNEIVVAVGDC